MVKIYLVKNLISERQGAKERFFMDNCQRYYQKILRGLECENTSENIQKQYETLQLEGD